LRSRRPGRERKQRPCQQQPGATVPIRTLDPLPVPTDRMCARADAEDYRSQACDQPQPSPEDGHILSLGTVPLLRPAAALAGGG
jgi:hypothetical protein